MENLIDHLQQLGFGEYEARAYIQLLQQSPCNGYALAKASGIPRANIYGVLQKLEERGAVVAVEMEGVNAYSPVPPNELIHRLGNRFEKVLHSTQSLLEQVTRPPTQHFVQNLRGYPVFVEHACDLINAAAQNLTIALWQPEALVLAPNLAQASERGVELTTLCLQACPEPCGGCQGHLHRYHVTSPQAAQWLIVIADETEMVMGTTGQEAVAIRTRQPHLIELTDSYVRHSIILAAMLCDLGGNLESMLKPETQALIASVGRGKSWLDTLLHTLKN